MKLSRGFSWGVSNEEIDTASAALAEQMAEKHVLQICLNISKVKIIKAWNFVASWPTPMKIQGAEFAASSLDDFSETEHLKLTPCGL